MIRIGLVLRQVEADAADEVPHAVPGEEVRLDAAPVTRDLLAEVRLELGPPGLQPGGIHVLGARGSGASRARAAREHRGGPARLPGRAAPRGRRTAQSRVTKSRAKSRKNPSAGRAAWATSTAPRWKEPGGWPDGEGGRDGLGGPELERRRVRILEEAQPSRGRDGGRESALRRGRLGAVTGHGTTGADGVERRPRR